MKNLILLIIGSIVLSSCSIYNTPIDKNDVGYRIWVQQQETRGRIIELQDQMDVELGYSKNDPGVIARKSLDSLISTMPYSKNNGGTGYYPMIPYYQLFIYGYR
jgi:hypothetical protein